MAAGNDEHLRPVQLELEQARYQTERSFRQCHASDPENRTKPPRKVQLEGLATPEAARAPIQYTIRPICCSNMATLRFVGEPVVACGTTVPFAGGLFVGPGKSV